MTARLSLAGLALVAAAAAIVPRLSPPALAAHEAPEGQDVSTLDDQTELALTVYNSDLALVRDVRSVQLPRGTFDLRFMDIAATVNPATVHVRSLTEPARLGVLEQNYEYDLLEPEKLLRKYVGRDVTLVRLRQDGGVTREETVTARLLSYNNAAGVADRQRDRDRHPCRSHPLPRAARQSLLASDADLDARQRRRAAPPGRGVVSRDEAGVECRLRPDRDPR